MSSRPRPHSPPPGYSASYSHYRAVIPPDEQTPLNFHPRKKQETSKFLLLLILATFVLLPLVVIRSLHKPWDEMDPAVRDRIRREWEHEKYLHELERNKWELEREWEKWDRQRLRGKLEHQLAEVEHEREELRRQREELELEKRRKHEEEERQRLAMYWDQPDRAPHCSAFSTRTYTARLLKVPVVYDRMQACRQTPIEIHGVKLATPDRCDDRGSQGLYGRWDVTLNEPECISYWSGMWDRGCTADGSRLRRLDAELYDIHEGDDWTAMCSTTYASYNGRSSTPNRCELRAIRKGFAIHWGMFGIWELDDPQC